MLTSTIGQLTAASVIVGSGKVEGEQSSQSVYYTISALSAYITSQVQDSLIPVGFTYVQYPTMTAPSSIWTFGTWTDISSTFAGAFFRAEGGNASAFESGSQASAIGTHIHYSGVPLQNAGNRSVYGTVTTDLPGDASSARYDPTANTPTGQSKTSAQYSTAGTALTSIETRPLNYTIRIWRRTA